jgi:hypothetical protein
MLVAGLVLMALGVLYLRRPDVYRRGLWLKTSLAIRLLSEANYRRYMRALGIVFVVAGAVVAAYGVLSLFNTGS